MKKKTKIKPLTAAPNRTFATPIQARNRKPFSPMYVKFKPSLKQATMHTSLHRYYLHFPGKADERQPHRLRESRPRRSAIGSSTTVAAAPSCAIRGRGIGAVCTGIKRVGGGGGGGHATGVRLFCTAAERFYRRVLFRGRPRRASLPSAAVARPRARKGKENE